MKHTITITSKGQTTLPVAVRRKLGIGRGGGALQADFNESTGRVIISRRTSVAEVSEQVSRHIKAGTPPVMNVDAYYQSQRQPRATV